MNYDFFLRKSFNDEDLANAIGSLLDIVPSGILVIDDITETEETADVIVERRILKGDFPCFLSVYIGIPTATETEIDFVADVSRTLGCDALCAGDDPSPYLWVLIQQDQRISEVLLSDEPFEERGEAVLCDLK